MPSLGHTRGRGEALWRRCSPGQAPAPPMRQSAAAQRTIGSHLFPAEGRALVLFHPCACSRCREAAPGCADSWMAGPPEMMVMRRSAPRLTGTGPSQTGLTIKSSDATALLLVQVPRVRLRAMSSAAHSGDCSPVPFVSLLGALSSLLLATNAMRLKNAMEGRSAEGSATPGLFPSTPCRRRR